MVKCVHHSSQLLGRQVWRLEEFLACDCPACRWLSDVLCAGCQPGHLKQELQTELTEMGLSIRTETQWKKRMACTTQSEKPIFFSRFEIPFNYQTLYKIFFFLLSKMQRPMFILALFKIREKLEMSKCPKLKKCSIQSGTSILLNPVCASVCACAPSH